MYFGGVFVLYFTITRVLKNILKHVGIVGGGMGTLIHSWWEHKLVQSLWKIIRQKSVKTKCA